MNAVPGYILPVQNRARGGKARRALRLARRQEGGGVDDPVADAPPLSPDQIASMTHQAPSAPQPYMHPAVPGAVSDISEFLPGGRGVSGIMARHGIDYPGEDTSLVKYLQSPDAMAALGTIGGLNAAQTAIARGARPGAGVAQASAEQARGAGADEETLSSYLGAGAAGGDRRAYGLTEVPPDLFHQALEKHKPLLKFGSSVTLHEPEEYANMRTFLSPDMKAGYALDGNNIVSAFRNRSAATSTDLLNHAIANGGRRLDAFDTVLPELYSEHGFRATGRVPWNEEFRPPDWKHEDYQKFNGGRPDIVFMVHDPANAGRYEPGQGRYFDSYDEADTYNKLMVGPDLVGFRSMKEAADRGNWDFVPAGRREGWGPTAHTTYAIEPNDIPQHWQKLETPGRRERTTYFDPALAEKYEEPGYDFRGVRLKSGVKDEFPAEREPGTIYRGMSWEDYQNGLKNGQFQSRGEYNIGDSQRGLTFYSSNPEQALSYAHGFAPWQYKGTPSRPAVVIAVRDPGQYDQVVGQTELGLRNPVPVSDLKDVYIGRPAIVRPGTQDFYTEYGRPWTKGGGSSPSIAAVWSKLRPQKRRPGGVIHSDPSLAATGLVEKTYASRGAGHLPPMPGLPRAAGGRVDRALRVANRGR